MISKYILQNTSAHLTCGTQIKVSHALSLEKYHICKMRIVAKLRIKLIEHISRIIEYKYNSDIIEDIIVENV